MKKAILNTLFARSINRDLTLGLTLTIVIVALVLGSINYIIAEKRETRILQEEANAIARNIARLAGQSIYQEDHSRTALIGQEYRKESKVASIFIFDEMHGIHYTLGDENQEGYITAINPIMVADTQLGTVRVALSKDRIVQRQGEFLLYTIIIAACMVLVIGTVTILFTETVFRKPLSAFIDGVRAIAAGSYDHRLSPMKDRYMNLIAQSVNAMAKNIFAREQSLNLLVGALEKQVAERKEAEIAVRVIKERFEDMSNLLPEPVYEIDKNGFFTFLNRSGFERFGCSSKEIGHGLRLIDLFAAQDRQRIEENLEKTLNGQEVGVSEHRVQTKNGVEYPALVHFNPIIHEEKITGVRGIAMDISQKKRNEEALLEYQEKLRLLSNELILAEERERRRIAAEIHDRIGHALTQIAMKIGLLKNMEQVDNKNDAIREINELLEQSTRDVQSLIFEISPPILYDIGLLSAIDWLIEQTSKEHGLKIVFRHDGELESFDQSSRVLVFRAVRELLFNVIKHAQAHNVEVSVARKNGDLLISVLDDGIGIPVNNNEAQHLTAGFGLFSIRERLSHFNGHLIIDSKPGKGSRVTTVSYTHLRAHET